MAQIKSGLSGIEKASVLLMSLGPEASKEILERLSPEERDLLDMQLSRMKNIRSAVKRRVLAEVGRAVKNNRQAENLEIINSDPRPLKWMEKLDPEYVAQMLAGERPHNIALILSQFSPNAAAMVLMYIDEKAREAVAERIANMGRVSPEAIKSVDELMRKRATESSGEMPHGAESILRNLSNITKRIGQSVISTVSHSGAEAQTPSGYMTSLEELSSFPGSRIREIIGELDLDDLCLALRVASDDLKTTVFKNVSATTAALLRENLDSPVQVKVREIEFAQKRLIDTINKITDIHQLFDAGVIDTNDTQSRVIRFHK